jgi:hypothetical protein
MLLRIAAIAVFAAQSTSDYSIYRAIVGSEGSENSRNAVTIVMDSTAAGGLVTAGLKTEFMRRQFGFFASAYLGTVDDFIARNRVSVKFDRDSIKDSSTFRMIGRRDLPMKDGSVEWEQYYRKFPGTRGYTTFSRPGFNAEKTYALVYFRNRCGVLCGGGGYYLLRLLGNRWIVVRRVETMMS